MRRGILHIGSAFLLAACAQQGEPDEATTETTAETTAETIAVEADPSTSQPAGSTARADIRDAQGNSLGVVDLEDTDFGVTLSGALTGLSLGEHGFHVHEVGLCEPPAFESAGGHFAPAGRRHGFHDPDGPHAGDLRNLMVSEDGSATVDMADSLVTLRRGASALLDGDGSALVVHADPDDYRSQPSGNSGDRVACGLIEG
ncbi:MAG: superoxide dismutase family protein [Gemmatimonadota bacterium]